MKKALLLITALLILSTCFSQEELKQLIDEGIALHDKGDFTGAIAKYDAAIKMDPSNVQATYEKAYSLMELKKYDEALTLMKTVLAETKNAEYRRLAYVSYGTILDYKGDKKEAVEVYERGIKEFPDSYLLHFNKGITQSGMNKPEEAMKSFQESVSLNPFHASSHNALARLQYDKNRIPAVLAFFTFLLIEPRGKRAEQNLELLNKLLFKGISKGENGNVTISIDTDMLNKKKKNKEDDFSSAELMLSLLGADNTVADSLGAQNDADRLSYKMQMLIGMIQETKSKAKGFFKNFYVPMLTEMKEKNFMKTASYVAMSSSGNKEITDWLENNRDAMQEFISWYKGYWKE